MPGTIVHSTIASSKWASNGHLRPIGFGKHAPTPRARNSALASFSKRFTLTSRKFVVPRCGGEQPLVNRQRPDRVQAEEIIVEFDFQHKVKGGTLKVRVLEGRDIVPGAALLVSAFEGTLQNRPPVMVKKLLLDSLSEIPNGVCLVGDLVLDEGTEELAGIVSLSFNACSRETNMSDPPPEDATYLSNMAVDTTLRRRGIAKAMLLSCNHLVQELGGADIWLHVLAEDKPARALYERSGYVAKNADVGTGKLLPSFFTRKPNRILMQNMLHGGPNSLFCADVQ